MLECMADAGTTVGACVRYACLSPSTLSLVTAAVAGSCWKCFGLTLSTPNVVSCTRQVRQRTANGCLVNSRTQSFGQKARLGQAPGILTGVWGGCTCI